MAVVNKVPLTTRKTKSNLVETDLSSEVAESAENRISMMRKMQSEYENTSTKNPVSVTATQTFPSRFK